MLNAQMDKVPTKIIVSLCQAHFNLPNSVCFKLESGSRFHGYYQCFINHPLYSVSSFFLYIHVLTLPLGPGWLKNLYFAYLLVLRAVTKAEPYWLDYQFYTGNKTEDLRSRELVSQIISAAKLVAIW